MTNLVGILCGDKIFKRVISSALLLLLISGVFLSSFVDVSAQGSGPAGGVPGVDRPYRPGEVPTGYGPGLSFPSGVGGGAGSVGSGPLAPGVGQTIDEITSYTPASDAAAQAQMAENALIAQNMGSQPDGVLALIYSFVLSGVGWVVGIAGSAFDYAIDYFIIGFGQMYISYTGESIDRLWGTVRDIFNLTFIFGLVYIGFKMILDSSDSSARKMLVSLIGAALLVNFSLFITKFVIDFSNIAASQIYNAFESDGDTLSITNGFMTLMGINGMLETRYTAGGSFAYVLGVLIVFAILAYVFLAGAVMIIIRFVVLNIYMVFSPFMFLGWVFPALAGYSRDYWSGFLRQAFFAPAFIFMLYLSYVVASTFPGQRNMGHMFNPNGSTVTDVVSMIPYFAMVIVFLCASMIVAKKMGAQGASFAMSTSGKIVGGATVGLAARASRSTIGAGAYNLTQSDKFKDVTSKFGRAGKSFYNATAKVGDSSFDARNVGGVGKKLGIGEGAKTGFTTSLKKQKESDEKFMKDLGTRDADKYDTRTKEAKADVEKWEDMADRETNPIKKAEFSNNAARAKKNYEAVKASYSAREEYARQLSFGKAIESWQKTQAVLTSAAGGAAAFALTGGLAPAVVGAAAGAGLGARNYYQNKQAAKAVRKEYGQNGLKKRKNSHEEHSLKKVLAALGDDHAHEPKPQTAPAGDSHSPAAKPAASKPAPVASSAPAAASHDHGH